MHFRAPHLLIRTVFSVVPFTWGGGFGGCLLLLEGHYMWDTDGPNIRLENSKVTLSLISQVEAQVQTTATFTL